MVNVVDDIRSSPPLAAPPRGLFSFPPKANAMNLDLGYTRLIIDVCKKHGLLRNQVAYVLATSYWESARTMRPVREYGSESYLREKSYYPYVGMGFVQLTWKRNYEKATKELGVDFVKNPKLLLEPGHAAEILVRGMKEGWFTGGKLSDYITLQKSDFVQARRIVNGTDKAAQLANYARAYDADLKKIGYGEAEEAPTEAGALKLLTIIFDLLKKFFAGSKP